MKPPVAKNAGPPDPYAWLRDKSSPDTIAYLEAENAYAAEVMAPHAQFVQQLYEEMLGRIKETDENVPFRKGAYVYYSRTEAGRQYPIWCRRRDQGRGTSDEEEIILDINELAAGKEFMDVGALEVSDDGNLLLFSTDDTGYRQYTLQVKDLRTGEILPDRAEKTESLLWAADNRTIFYTVENEAKRQSRLYRHVLGSDLYELIYEEEDELYDLFADRSRSGDWIFVVSESKRTNEVRLIPAATPHVEPAVMVPRREEHRYYPDHRGDEFYVMTNDAGINFRVVTAPVSDWTKWTELVPHRQPVKIELIDLFRGHMVITLREDGLTQFEIHDLGVDCTTPPHRIAFPEPAYATGPGPNEVFDTSLFRYVYMSPITPPSVFDYDMNARTATLLKQTEVLGGYDPSRYVVERFFVTASDGARIPVALVRGREHHAVLLYGYGAYGASIPDGFNSNRFSLIDRGIAFAVAHVRGGGEMGEEWHEQGRMMAKKNTFTDFIAVAEHLRANGYENVAIEGGSAGGLLLGAVLNMRPELFKAALVYVPFVDVMNTMMDPTLPLTTQEYIEWGNPSEPEAYAYMKNYDPYSNLERKAYPAMLVRTALNDSQVGYWEAAKWVARLRDCKTDENELLLLVNMGAGHGGSSGRYDKLREQAFDYGWVVRMLGGGRAVGRSGDRVVG